MVTVMLGLRCKRETKNNTFLMDQVDNHINCEHVIDIRSSSEASSSGSNGPFQHPDQSSTTLRDPISLTPSAANGSNPRNSLSIRRDGNGRHRRSPLNSGLWISMELVLTVCQIVASVVVLSLSKHENPRTPFFGWVVGYTSGCVATLPLLYWRWYYLNQAPETVFQNREGSVQNISPASLSTLSNTRNSVGNTQPIVSFFRSPQVVGAPNPRLKELVEYFKMALDCFFAVWFVVGNVWIFGGHTSYAEAPNLYRLCIVFLAFSCIGYAMPFILCATICCCLPCILSMGFRDDINQNRGATSESINSLPTYKFKIKKAGNASGRQNNSAAVEGGVVAVGTEKERTISGEDAVCCICLAKYANNEELRELPCSHFFHKDCVDKWLKINASCPLCKGEVGESPLSSVPEASSL